MGPIAEEIEPVLWGNVRIFPKARREINQGQIEIKKCKKLAQAFYRFRRRRDEIFPKGLFADPAWDILLDLYAAELDGKKISITSACIASGVPPTTALRWIRVLEDKGLVFRHDDISDGRRSFVRITAEACIKITNLIMEG